MIYEIMEIIKKPTSSLSSTTASKLSFPGARYFIAAIGMLAKEIRIIAIIVAIKNSYRDAMIIVIALFIAITTSN